MSDQTTDTTQQQTESQASADGRTGDRGSVPYSRFAEVYDGFKQAKAEIESLRSKLSEADVHRAKADELAQELAKVRSDWEEERVFTASGLLDGEAQDVARFVWSRLADDQRPEGGMASWLADLKADPSKAPRALSPYLQPQVQVEKPTPKQAPPAGPGPSRAVPAAVDVTADAIRQATERAVRTRDWTEVERLTAAAMAARKR